MLVQSRTGACARDCQKPRTTRPHIAPRHQTLDGVAGFLVERLLAAAVDRALCSSHQAMRLLCLCLLVVGESLQPVVVIPWRELWAWFDGEGWCQKDEGGTWDRRGHPLAELS